MLFRSLTPYFSLNILFTIGLTASGFIYHLISNTSLTSSHNSSFLIYSLYTSFNFFLSPNTSSFNSNTALSISFFVHLLPVLLFILSSHNLSFAFLLNHLLYSHFHLSILSFLYLISAFLVGFKLSTFLNWLLSNTTNSFTSQTSHIIQS